ncbi:hypothetical protein [Capnocytophaga bilenii]
MNFKHIHTEENINNFIFLENELIFQKEDSVYNFSKKNSVINKLKYKHIFFDSNFIYSHPILYTKEGVIVREFTDDQAFIFFINPIKDYVISIKSKTNFKERAYSIFLNDNLIRNLPFKEYFILKKYFIKNKVFLLSSDNSIIYFYDIFNSNEDCQYDLETYFHQPAQIMEGRVLVSNNKIIFFAHTEDWSNYATFVLDAQTGEVLFTTQEMGMKLITYNDFVYQIQRKAIKILDPKNLKIETIDVSAYCDDQSIFLDDHTVFFYKDKLYTLAREQGSDVYNIWVVFNLKTQLFEYREDMYINPKKKKDEKNKMFINDIQANDNLVAIRCSDNLYIFEKKLDE